MTDRLLDALPPWARSATGGDLFASGPWFEHFVATALRADELPRIVQWPGTVGSAPLALALKTGRGEVFPHPRLLESMTSYYSCGYGPICADVIDASGQKALVGTLAAAARRFDGVRLGPLDRESAFARAAEAGLRSAGYRTCWTLAYRNWYASTEGLDYAGYLQRLKSSFPSTSEKRRLAFLRKGTGTISIASSTQELTDQVSAYESVYASSWKVPEPFTEFIPGLIRLAAQRGWLRLGILRVGEEPAAAQLWFVVDGRALIYKVAYVERFAKLSVGSMLTCAILEHVLNVDRVRELDFLSGDDEYKAKWMFARRDRHTLLAFNPLRWRGLAAAAREALAQRRDARARAREAVAEKAPDAG